MAKNQKGFSLVEVLIVIGIIILLGLISVIALSDQQAKARDAKRISDIRQIRTALEFYYGDKNEYPIVEQPVAIGKNGREKLCSKESGGFVPANTECKSESTYMSLVPSDPLGNKQYTYLGVAQGYDITFQTEKTSSLGPAGTYHAHTETIDMAAGTK